jgi:hypothetical protein
MFVHGARTVTSERYVRTDEGVYVVGGPAPEPKSWERDSGLLAARSMLLAARAVCDLFGWAEPPELADLLRKVEQEALRPRG